MHLLSPSDVANVPGYPDTQIASPFNHFHQPDPPSGAKITADLDRLLDVLVHRVDAVAELGAESIAAPLGTSVAQLGYVIDHAGSALRELDDTRAANERLGAMVTEKEHRIVAMEKHASELLASVQSLRSAIDRQAVTLRDADVRLADTVRATRAFRDAVEGVLREEARAGRIARTAPRRLLRTINYIYAAPESHIRGVPE